MCWDFRHIQDLLLWDFRHILPVNLWDFRHFLFGNWDFIAISSEIRLSVIRPFNKDEFVMMETMADELTTLFKAEKLRELCCLSKVLDNCKSGIALRASSTAIPAGWASFPKGKACPWRKLPGHKIAPKAHKISASLHLPKSGESLDLKLSAVEFYARKRNFTR